MKILLVSYIEPDAPCGVRTYYRILQRGLTDSGHEVRLITPSCAPVAARWIAGGVRRVLGVGNEYANLVAFELKNWWRIRAAIRTLRWVPDIVHAQDVGSGAAAVLSYRCPVLVTAHFNEDPVEELLDSYNLTGHSARWLRRRFSRQFSLIRNYIAPSDHAATCLRRLAPADSFVKVISNACDFKFISAANPAVDIRRLTGTKKIILSAGTLEPRKDPWFLMELAKELSSHDDLVMLHAGDGPLKNEMEAAKTARKLSNIHFLGYREDLAAVMKTASLFVHFPLRETFGLVLIEAIAAGVPVLARKVGGISDILAGLENQSLYAANACPAVVGQDIAALITDQRRLDHLAGEQYRMACCRFDIPTFLQSMTGTYQWLLSYQSPPT